MERYRVRASFNNPDLSPTTSSFQTKPSYSQISLPPKPPISSYLQSPTSKASALSRRVDDAEISIFDAERYFNEGQQNCFDGMLKKTIILNAITDSCDASTNPRDSSVSSADGYGRNWRNRSFRATPTSSSEASWNSLSGLLSNPPGSMAISVRAFPLNEKRRKGSSPFSTSRRFFGRNCPCYGKKSVDVEEKHAEPKSPVRFSSDNNKGSIVTSTTSIDSLAATKEAEEVAKLKISAGIWAKDPTLFSTDKPCPAEIGHRIVNTGRPFGESAGFSFPILAPPPTSGTDDLARHSLEVFRPADELANLRSSAEFTRRPVASAGGDDDLASDTSSDLFEIESFSTHSAYRRRDSLDEFPKLVGSATAGIFQFRRSLEDTTASIAPSECYAPSEVSVEWSVTTAEGGFDRASMANFSSAASDCDDTRFIQSDQERFGSGNGGGNRKKGTGGLLSCRCENSVNVGPNPVRIGAEQRRGGNMVFAVEPERGLGMSKFAVEKAELVRSHSARMNRTVQTR